MRRTVARRRMQLRRQTGIHAVHDRVYSVKDGVYGAASLEAKWAPKHWDLWIDTKVPALGNLMPPSSYGTRP